MTSHTFSNSSASLLSAPLSQLHDVEWEKKEPAIQLLLKLLQNIVNDPGNLKLRRIKRSNATLQSKLFSVVGCADFLHAVGFQDEGADFLVLLDTVDVTWAIDELQAFGNSELMQHLREERDRKISIAREGEVKCKNGAAEKTYHINQAKHDNSTSHDGEEDQVKLLHQLELDRKERAERQQMKQDRQVLQRLTHEREERKAKEKAQSIADLKSSGAEKDFWQTSKGKKKAWVKNKKKGKKGNSAANVTDLGTGRGGRTSGYREIPIPESVGPGRTVDREIAAALAASAAESRTNRVDLKERRLVEIEHRQNRESKALAANRTARSRKLAIECQQAASRTSEHGSMEAKPPPLWGEKGCEVSQHAVPADNSCLFHAISHLMAYNDSPASLRSLVAMCMRREPERWNDVTLAEGRTVEEYGRWITHPSSWGGFVDLIVLSECFRTQISVMSLESLYWTHYPDDAKQYDRRIYLLYDGVHYDAVVGHSSGSEVLVFNPLDETIMNRIIEMARTLHRDEESSVFYQCEECTEILVGQANVAKHSFDTCHCNFRELTLDDIEMIEASDKIGDLRVDNREDEDEEEEEEEDDGEEVEEEQRGEEDDEEHGDGREAAESL